ncbi:MAG: hypothetical protein P4L82_16480 [Ancalomicrobiaceae bacterium]|nr:hypothetical protein [Ancalomicrobiaceae bacterium]
MTTKFGWTVVLALGLAGMVQLVATAARPEAAEPAPAPVPEPTLRWQVGGGNLVTHLAGPPSEQLYQALAGVGAQLARMDSYGWRDLQHRPTPHDFDAAMLDAYRHGITPIILLEYEGSYQFLDPPQPLGTRREWAAAGESYARRFAPNGDWAREHGIVDWGVTVFSAINEPDVQATIPKAAYHDALAGFAEGIHRVDPRLKVVPGGFATCNSDGDTNLRGYGPAIADLIERGDLDGIDLHTYYNARWYPLTKGREFSAQACFDKIKTALGIRRDIGFYATEYNISRDDAWEDPAVAASLFLTAFWDEMTVVGADGRTPVTRLAFPWNLGDTEDVDGPAYAMATAKAPWRGDLRADVLARVLGLAGDMRLSSVDRAAGTLTLDGPAGELQVWHDRPGWSDRIAVDWDVVAPAWAGTAELWGWRGRMATARVVGGHVRFGGLTEHGTYMALFPKAGR